MRRGPLGWLAINGSGHAGGAISRMGCGLVIVSSSPREVPRRISPAEYRSSPRVRAILTPSPQKPCHPFLEDDQGGRVIGPQDSFSRQK